MDMIYSIGEGPIGEGRAVYVNCTMVAMLGTPVVSGGHC